MTTPENTTGGILHPAVAERIRGLEAALAAATQRVEPLIVACRKLMKTWIDFGDDDAVMNPLDTELPEDIVSIIECLERLDAPATVEGTTDAPPRP